jgi:hypothetical protein
VRRGGVKKVGRIFSRRGFWRDIGDRRGFEDTRHGDAEVGYAEKKWAAGAFFEVDDGRVCLPAGGVIINVSLAARFSASGSRVMTYMKVRWIHSFSDQPVLLYSELDAQRGEARKVEIFPDGGMGCADRERETKGTSLSTQSLPSLAEIAADPQFEPVEITKAEFEAVWAKATD